MLLVFETVMFVLGCVVSIALRHRASTLLRLTVAGALVLGVVLVLIVVTGSPRYRQRVRADWAPLDQQSTATAHSRLAHGSLLIVALIVPIFVAASFVNRRRPWRRAAHLSVVFLVGAAWMMAEFTGYLSPKVVSVSPPAEDAATILRFVLLHVFVLPGAIASLLCVLAWRNLQLARRITA
jgi:uncharacterized membrane protein YoaK (UPF0700 family)